MSGPFAKRLEAFTPLGFTSKPVDPANPPDIDSGQALPHVLLMRGVPVGVAHALAGLALETGTESQRLLAAVTDLIHELIHAKDQPELLAKLRELADAGAVIGRHLDKAAAAFNALPLPPRVVH